MLQFKTIKYTLPIQIHTGIQAGNGNVLSNSNPLHLANLFLQYRQGKFVLFHGGYPFSGEAGIMAMNFPNVYLDACWLAHPSILTINLHQWIELVPGNKILVWGGDYVYPEPTYGSLQFAKDAVAQVLTEKIERVYLSTKSAIRLAHNMFGDNAKKLFQIK
ncbi:MAG: amidohydrolase family protein [Candidatus Bathyarchaeota archaeon]|nr:amidohydrolase family protein [Candidatus Bathyarchaeota archaeon]